MPKRKSGCFQPLEKKLYTRQEMAALTGIPLENKNFKSRYRINLSLLWLERRKYRKSNMFKLLWYGEGYMY